MDRRDEGAANEIETIVVHDRGGCLEAGVNPALEDLLLRACLPEIQILHCSQVATGSKDEWCVRWRREDYPKMYAVGSGPTIRDAVVSALESLPDYEIVRAGMRERWQGPGGN